MSRKQKSIQIIFSVVAGAAITIVPETAAIRGGHVVDNLPSWARGIPWNYQLAHHISVIYLLIDILFWSILAFAFYQILLHSRKA